MNRAWTYGVYCPFDKSHNVKHLFLETPKDVLLEIFTIIEDMEEIFNSEFIVNKNKRIAPDPHFNNENFEIVYSGHFKAAPDSEILCGISSVVTESILSFQKPEEPQKITLYQRELLKDVPRILNNYLESGIRSEFRVEKNKRLRKQIKANVKKSPHILGFFKR